MKISKFAPVFIPTLNRDIHFKRCVESLSRCTHADKTDLYIALDYPANESHWVGYNKIKKFIKEISGFKSVRVIERKENFGAIKNYYEGRSFIFKNYDRFIFSEDDNEFSPNFLDYINKGLDLFQNDPLVSAICGYKFPFDVPENYPYNYFFSKGFSAWGYGMWKEKCPKFHFVNDICELNSFLHKPLNVFKLNDIQYGLLEGLKAIVKTKIILGDRMYAYLNVKNNTYSIFPAISKVRNHGHDESGEHSHKIIGDNPFVNKPIDNKSNFDYLLHKDYNNKSIYKAFRNHNHSFIKTTFKMKIKRVIKYFIFFIKH